MPIVELNDNKPVYKKGTSEVLHIDACIFTHLNASANTTHTSGEICQQL